MSPFASPDTTECLDSRGAAMARGRHKQFRWHHATVKPVGLSASLHAADHADVRSIDFGDDFCDEMLWQAEGIRQHCPIRWSHVCSSERNRRRVHATTSERHRTQLKFVPFWNYSPAIFPLPVALADCQ